MQKLTFLGAGARLAANLHGADATTQKRPALLVLGSWLTVKEQMATAYATRLAAAGYAAMTFDFRGFGASEGEPREVESGHAKARDIVDAAAFLATCPGVDAERIGVVAVCASAHYTALALQGHGSFGASSDLVKSVAMVAPWLHDADIALELYGGKDAVRDRLVKAAAARTRYVTTGEVEYVPAASNRDRSAAMYFEGDTLDYYLNPKRGAIAQWGNRFATMAWTEWLEMSSTALAPQFRLPLVVVTGDKSATPEGARRFVAKVAGPKEVIWDTPEAASQFHFYDNPATVDFAVARAVEHFGKTL